MIPLRDYLRIRKQIDDQNGWVGAVLLGSLVVGLIICVSAVSQVPLEHRQHPNWQEGGWLLLGVGGLLAPTVIALGLLIRLAPQPAHFPELKCPGCQRVLLDPTGVVIATGKCPQCLKHVLKPDSPPPAHERELLTIAQLQRVKRNQWRALVLGMSWCPASLGAVLLALVIGLLWPDLMAGRGQISEALSAVVMFTTFLGGMVIAALLYGWRIAVRCPSCRSLICAISTVIASGNCPRCSLAIVKDAVPHSEYRPLPKLAQVQQAMQQQAQRSLAWLLLGLLVGAITIGCSGVIVKYLPGSQATNVLRVVLYLAGSVFMLVPCGLLLSRRRFRRHPELLCPHCQNLILENSLALRCTGNCPHCGQRAIKDV